MSNYNSLKTTIDANIKQNGRQEITGQILNSVLNQMVTTLGAGYQFAGVATTATNPGTPDAKVFYIANGKGTYEKFGGINVTEDEVVVLYWDTAWHKEATGIASQAKLTELESKTNTKFTELISGVGSIKESPIYGDLSWEWGSYCDTSGTLQQSTYWGRKKFLLKKNQLIQVDTLGTSCTIIATSNDGITFEPLVTHGDTYKYGYRVPSDGLYYVFVRQSNGESPIIDIRAAKESLIDDGVLDSGTQYNEPNDSNRVCVYYPIYEPGAKYAVRLKNVNLSDSSNSIDIAFRKHRGPFSKSLAYDFKYVNSDSLIELYCPEQYQAQANYIGITQTLASGSCSFYAEVYKVDERIQLKTGFDSNVLFRNNKNAFGCYINSDKNGITITKDGFGLIINSVNYWIADPQGKSDTNILLKSENKILCIDKNVLLKDVRTEPSLSFVEVIPPIDYERYIPFACFGKNGLQFIEKAEVFNTYQEQLISGQNIKTINGDSILGKGDIVINPNDIDEQNEESYAIRKIIPSYYFANDISNESSITSDANEYIDGKIASVPDGKRIIFFTDVHWYGYNWTGGDDTGKTEKAISTPLMLYCKKKLGISNILFGGDVLEANMTQNKAKLEIRMFMNNVLSAFGSSLLLTMGNHDLNQYVSGSGYDWQSLLNFQVAQPLYFGYLKNVVYDNDLVSRATKLGYSGDTLAEIEAFSKTYYYYDDFTNKIRYIVVNTGPSLANSPLKTLEDTDGSKLLQLEYKFVIDALSTLPEGFDIILSGHLIIYYGGSSPYTVQGYALNLVKILSDFKTKRSGRIQSYSSQTYEDLSGVSNYDFSTHSDNIGKIIVICGDTHHDSSCICQTNNGVYESVPYYDNVEQKDDCILVVNTICEVCGGVGTSTGGNSTYYPTSKADWGTIKETAFDIISWNSNSVTTIRVGNGIDRIFNYK